MSALKDMEVEFTNYEKFWAIACHAESRIKKCVSERNMVKIKTDADVDYNCLKNAEIGRDAAIVVIFSALTLESFINYYAYKKLTKSYFEKYLDSLSPVAKWLIIPKISLGVQIDTGLEAFQELQNLFKLRNKLVHDKPKRFSASSIKSNVWLWESDAYNATDAVRMMMGKLAEMDKSLNLDWIEKSPMNPYA